MLSLAFKAIASLANVCTVTLAFTVLDPVAITTETEVVACGSFIYNDSTFTESTVYEATFKAVSGADSIVTLTLTVNPEYEVTDTKTVAYGEVYQFGTQLLSVTGEYTETYSSFTGCDSVVTLMFTVAGNTAFEISNDQTDISVDENLEIGSIVFIVTVNNANDDVVVYSISDESGAFTIDPKNGAVTVLDASQLDYETVKELSITVSATAGDSSAEKSFIISLNDVVDDVATSELQLNTDVYPTIASHTVTVKATGFEGKLVIASGTGTIVYASDFDETTIINVSDFVSGTYIVQLQSNDGAVSSRMIFKD